MSKIDLYLEIGKKRTWAGAVDWPGFCRSGKDEASAVQTLLEYRNRYAAVLHAAEIECRLPDEPDAYHIVERLPGNATTDFGAPNIPLASDAVPVGETELSRLQDLLRACWRAFDLAATAAAGSELRKGPRGGGRDLDKIVQHLFDADASYIRKLPYPFKRDNSAGIEVELPRLRLAMLDGLGAAAHGQLPDKGSRGGTVWLPRTFVRRVAWHLLDHLWEVEDRA